MTDHPGSTPPPGDPGDPGDSAASSRGPDHADGRDHPDDPFADAFAGPSWDSGRRRRPASADSDTSGTSTAAASGSGRELDSSQRSPGSRRRRSGRRARHVRAVVVHVVLGVLGLAVAWIVVTGLLAAYQLQQARSDLTGLRSEIAGTGAANGSASLEDTARDLVSHAHHADVLTRGPAWALAARIPYVGAPLETVRGIAHETSDLVDAAVPGVVAVADDVDPRSVVKGGAVDLAAVSRAGPAVQTAAAATATARADVDALPHSTWLGPVDSAAGTLRDQLGELDTTLRSTDQALQVLPTLLGGDGRTRRYFVAFQNNAELRGTGGLPGAFAIVAATDGRVSIERFESDNLLQGTIPTGLDFGAAFDQQYAGDLAYTQYVNSNLSPHFPYAAQIWCAMWRNATGQQLDGALTIDPGALAYLLAATGPTTGPDGKPVTADNVVALLQKDVYAQFPEPGENDDRKKYILEVASAVEKKILTSGNGRALLQGLARSVGERRIVLWSADQAAEQVIAGTTIGGTVATTDQPYSLLALNNAAAGKLDYYLGRSVTWTRTGCGATRQVTVTITLTNNAPASGLPPYVTERVGTVPDGFVPGQNRTSMSYVATTGAQLLGATLDGAQSGAAVFDEEGHPSFQLAVELKPGQTRTWVLSLLEPAGTEPVTVVRQPGVLPLDVTVDDRSCS